MLGKLTGGLQAAKDKAGEGMVEKVVDMLGPSLREHLDKLHLLDGAAVKDDDSYKSKFVNPTLVALAVSTSGVTRMIPNFDGRFTGAMLHLRDELICVCDSSGAVTLAADSQHRLPAVLREGFKKSA